MLKVFADILVTPYTALLGAASSRRGGGYEGGPHWPNFSTQCEVRHCFRGGPVDRAPRAPDGPVSRLPGRFAWAGAIVPHFGHQLLDHSMRLGPTLIAEPDVSFVFACHAESDIRSWWDTPTFFREIARWHGLDDRRVHIVSEPTQVDTLLVAPQAEQGQLAVPPAEAYLDYLDALVERHLVRGPRAGVVYVSRSWMPYHYAGEGYLERVFQDAGVCVIHPECLTLVEQLRAYCGAEFLVLAQGSALHGLQLLGRTLGHVRVVQRTHGGLGWLEPALSVRAESIEFVNALRGVLPAAGIRGSEQTWRGMAILDEEALLAALPTVFGDSNLVKAIRHRWQCNEFSAHVQADVLRWATGLCHGRSVAFPESIASVLEQLPGCGLGSLARQVEQCLARGFLASLPDRLQRAARGERGTSDPNGGRRVAEAVVAGEAVPDGAQVLIMSKGDPAMLALHGVDARHFPATDDGVWIGYHPANSAEAIAWLEAARTRGGRYLLIPGDSLWWLDHYPEFTRRLLQQGRQISSVPREIALFALG